MVDAGGGKVELLAGIIADSLAEKDLSVFIKNNCSLGCYACGKKLKEFGAPFSILRHYCERAWCEDKDGLEMLSLHRGVFYFLEEKLGQLYPDVPDPDNGKKLVDFVNIASIGEVDRKVKEKMFEPYAKYFLPTMGVMVNLPARQYRGEIGSRFEDKQILEFLLMKGYEPVSVKTIWDDGGFCRCALVYFGQSLDGLFKAKSFEDGFMLKGFGRGEWNAYMLQNKTCQCVWMGCEGG